MKHFLLAILLLFFISPIAFCGRVHVVKKNTSLSSIQAAINEAKDGDTILVYPGIYKEKNIQVNKSLVLIGKNFPVLDGEHIYEMVSIHADNVVFEGFKLIHSGVSSLTDIAAIKVFSRRNVQIKDNILDDTFFGIYLQKAVSCIVENNQLTGEGVTDQQSGNGIHCWQCDSIRIIRNSVKSHRDGIYFEFVNHSLIIKNISANNIRYGLHFMFSNNNTYVGNTFKNNNAGVSVMFSHDVNMFNNVFEDNWGDGCYGIFLKEITDSYISGNQFRRNTTGIFVEGATRLKVEKNQFIKNGWALKIDASCQAVNLAFNNFLGNSFDVGTNGTLVSNFSHNYWDKYEGYDLNKNNVGDVPYHPVSLFSMIVSKNPSAMILFRSVMASLLDKVEKILPSLTPENLVDHNPYMKPIRL